MDLALVVVVNTSKVAERLCSTHTVRRRSLSCSHFLAVAWPFFFARSSGERPKPPQPGIYPPTASAWRATMRYFSRVPSVAYALLTHRSAAVDLWWNGRSLDERATLSSLIHLALHTADMTLTHIGRTVSSQPRRYVEYGWRHVCEGSRLPALFEN